MAREVAELRKAVFKLRSDNSGRVDADFVLTIRTPEGVEHCDFGWTLQTCCSSRLSRARARERFDSFMRGLFDDHMSDLRQRGLDPDRGYDELPIRLDIPEEILRRIS